MPHFSSCPKHAGADEWICQKCGRVFCSGCVKSEWRPDITGHKSAGNACPECVRKEKEPISLFEHCKEESGLTETHEINRYMNRHYGHE